jgi:hypothetical protein
MNQRQENKNRSNLNVEDLFSKNPEIIESSPDLNACNEEIKANRVITDDLIARQTINIDAASDKNIKWDAVINSTMGMSKILVAYATVKEKPAMLTEVKVNESVLKRLADTRIKGVSQGIYDVSVKYAVETLSLGNTPEARADLQTKINDFNDAITKPKLRIDDEKQITAELDKAFKRGDALLVKTDALIDLYKESKPVFHSSYFNLRKIIEYGKGTLALQIQVKDALTGEGLPKVKLEIARTEEMSKASTGADLVKNVKISSAKGGSKEKSMPDGKYSVTASRTDYASQTVNFTIVGGIMTNVVINMVKE